MKECPKCHAMIEDDAVFCGVCGTKQEFEEVDVQAEEQSSQEEQFCVHCGKSIEVGSLFCPYCGKPQNVEGTKNEEPQTKTEEPEPEQEESQPEEPHVKEEPKVEETPKEEAQAEEEPAYEMEEEKKSRSWLWILLGVLLIGIIGGGSYLMSQNTDSSNSENNDVTMTTSPNDESTLPTDPKEFLESMYKDFFKNRNFDTQNISNLHKYLSPSVAKEINMECPYDGGEGDFSYVVDFFCDGSLSYERPDYGNKVVSRTIEPEGDDWYKVTNIWDVIKDPVIVHLQVKSVDGVLKIVDIRAENDNTEIFSEEFDRESVEKELKAFLAEYVNTLNDNIFTYLSDDFKGVIKKWESTPNVGEWNLFGLNSTAEIRKYIIESLTEPVDNRLCAHVKIWIENEEDYYEDETNIYLINVGDKWLVDEIDEVKQNMKTALSKM